MGASTSRTISYNAKLTSTREKYHKNGVPQDAIFEAIPTLNALRNKGSFKVDTAGGEVIRINIINEKNSNGKAFAGYEAANLTPQDEFTIAYDQWRQYSWTTPISGLEIFQNSGDSRIFPLLEQKEKVTYMSATEDINRDLYDAANLSATGTTGTSGKQINPIPLLVQALPTDGQDVHGIDQSAETYFQNRAIDGSGMTTRALFLQTLRHAVNMGNRGRGGGMIDLLAFDQNSYELFEDALDEKVRYMQTAKATPGFEKIHYKGVECFWDVYVCDAGDNSKLGTNGGPSTSIQNGSIYGLNSKCMKFYIGKGKDFSPTPFVDGTYQGQDAKLSMTLLYAQLVADSRRNQMVIYDVPVSWS